jgi:non-canonical (house-cleaning) NTP pyrophosphatase
MPDRPSPPTTTGPWEGDGTNNNNDDNDNIVVVAIGSKNPAKSLGTRNAFSRFFRRVEVREVDVSSQVRAQPMNLQETLAGARARAVIALRSLEGVEGRIDFGVGVEAGIMALRVAGAATTITAAAAAAVVPGVDVGEEMGQEEEKGEEEEEGESLNLQLAAITDSTGRIHYGCSSGFPLPSQLVSRMRKDGRELDAYAHELTGAPKIREEEGIIYHLSKGNLSRVEMTEQCVSMALLPWVNREAYDLRRLDEKKS